MIFLGTANDRDGHEQTFCSSRSLNEFGSTAHFGRSDQKLFFSLLWYLQVVGIQGPAALARPEKPCKIDLDSQIIHPVTCTFKCNLHAVLTLLFHHQGKAWGNTEDRRTYPIALIL